MACCESDYHSYVALASLRVLVDRWNQTAEGLRQGTVSPEMSSEEAMAVAAQLEQCAEDLYDIMTTRQAWRRSPGDFMRKPIPLKCPICGIKSITVKSRLLNTQYEDEQKNWQRSCKWCYDRFIAYYEELWKDYYYSRL